MKLYAELPGARTRQLAGDVAMLVWAALWIAVGRWVHELVAPLAGPGASIEDAGDRFATSLERVVATVEGVPVAGRALRAPFAAAAEAGRVLEAAGRTQQETVLALAWWLGVLLAVVPIVVLVVPHVRDRLRWAREATVAARLRDESADLRLFAYRAVANRPLQELRRAVPDPGGALAAGDFTALAAVELRGLGLEAVRPHPHPISGGASPPS
ncbi:MAG TPA: hypothetical protein VHF25_04945 [Nitriliruptorales bacterium]|nr:hypothetical protein [Nitriliruptorales bacterium]